MLLIRCARVKCRVWQLLKEEVGSNNKTRKRRWGRIWDNGQDDWMLNMINEDNCHWIHWWVRAEALHWKTTHFQLLGNWRSTSPIIWRVEGKDDQCIAMWGRVSLNLLMSLNRSVALMSCGWNISVAWNQEAFLQGWGYSKREWLLRTNDAGFNDEFVQKLMFLALAVHRAFQLLWTKGPRMRTIEGEIKSKSVDELVQKRCTLCRLSSLPYHTWYLSPEP